MIDWYVAERIAWQVAGHGDAPAPLVDLRELTAESERRVVAYTGLTPAQALPEPEGVSRREWVASNIRSMRALIDPVLLRATGRLGPLAPGVQFGLGVAMSVEVGVLVGYLGQRVLGQYELVLLDESPELHPPRLLFVLPNLGHAVRTMQADEREFMIWVALHEVTHAVQFGGVPWLQGHLAGLVRELMRSAEAKLDPGSASLRIPGPDAVANALRSLARGDLLSIVANPAERSTLDRIQATMAVIEGHAEHVMDAVAPDLLPSLPRMRHSLDERRRSQRRLSRLISRLLGMEMKLAQYERGKVFIDAIAREGGPDALTRLFSEPAYLPSIAEIADPRAWLVRTT